MVICINTLKYAIIILTHHHDADLVFNLVVVVHCLGLEELQRKQLLIRNPLSLENEPKATFIYSANYFIYQTRVFFLENGVL
jgi:hypothetical protein